MRSIIARLVGVMALVCVGSLVSTTEAAPLRVATFKCDMTTPLGHTSFPSGKPLEVIEHPLMAKGIVLEDGGQRYVFCVIDWCSLCNSTHLLYRQKIAAAAGTDPSRVALHTVHQHTAPTVNLDATRMSPEAKNPQIQTDVQFFELAADWLAQAVKASLARLEPFDRIGTGEAKVERVGSTRRVIDPDGKVHTPRWSYIDDIAVRERPEGIIDPMLKTITFAQGEKPLVRLHYYACHPQSFYNDPRVTYDFPGMAREELEQKEHVFQVYFTGCAGDVLTGKYNDHTLSARDELRGRLLRGMEAAIVATKFVPAESIRWRTVELKLPLFKPADLPESDRPKKSEGKMNTGLASYAARLDRPLLLSSLQIGHTHILDLPGECLVEYQLFAQRSAREFVAVAAYTDLGTGYICTDIAFDQGGYEPTVTKVGRGSEALLKDAILELLGVK